MELRAARTGTPEVGERAVGQCPFLGEAASGGCATVVVYVPSGLEWAWRLGGRLEDACQVAALAAGFLGLWGKAMALPGYPMALQEVQPDDVRVAELRVVEFGPAPAASGPPNGSRSCRDAAPRPLPQVPPVAVVAALRSRCAHGYVGTQGWRAVTVGAVRVISWRCRGPQRPADGGIWAPEKSKPGNCDAHSVHGLAVGP